MKRGRITGIARAAISAAFVFVIVSCFATPAFAQDASYANRVAWYDDNNCGDGYSTAYPKEAWDGFEMIYWGGNIFELFYVPYNNDDPYDEVSMYIYKRKSTDPPVQKPDQFKVREIGQTYAESNRRHTAARFAVFRDQLYLFNAKGYDGKDYKSQTGYIIWGRQWDPVNETFPSDVATQIVEKRPGNPAHTTANAVVNGMVVKTMNDLLYIVYQARTTNELYVITYDGETYNDPVLIHTFTGNDSILNGEVCMRGSDGAPVLAFVTKDDSSYSGGPTGLCRLYVYDPATTIGAKVVKVADFPNKYKDIAMVQGNALGCLPYSTGSLQFWGIPWESDTLVHMQCILDRYATSATFDPSGRTKHGDVSVHIDTTMRGLLTACSAPEQVSDVDLHGSASVSLKFNHHVWWWSNTKVGNVFGQSLRYKGDVMRNEGPQGSPTPGSLDNKVSDAASLLGIVTGLPPYYGNNVAREKLESFYKVKYGMSTTLNVSTTVKTKGSMSFSYKKEGIFGISKAFMGFGFSSAVEEMNKTGRQTKISTTIEFSPSLIMPVDMDDGAQAWGIFLAPYVTSDRYEIFGPDRDHEKGIVGTDLGLKLYYTYIGDNSSIITHKFDMTSPTNSFNLPYFADLAPLPNSLKYEEWKGGGPPVEVDGTSDYDMLLCKQILTTDSGYDHSFDQTVTVENEKTNTNEISVSGGMYGFSSEVKGTLTMASANSTALGTNFGVHYAVPTFQTKVPEPEDWDRFLTGMDMYMYLLNAKTSDAFWIPKGAKQPGQSQYPWCLTWRVNDYKNMGMVGNTLFVGDTQPYHTVSGALSAVDPTMVNVLVQVHNSVIDIPIVIAGRSVHVKGAASTLDRDGNPTIVIETQGVTVEDGAYLRLENVVIDAGGGVPAILNRGGVSLRNCRILGEPGIDGIVLDGGVLTMDKSRVSACGGDGLRVIAGRATLVNCAVISNAANGIRNDNGTVLLKHCAVLGNGTSDLFTSSSADSEAVNTVIGSISPESRISRLQNCLVEDLPRMVMVDSQENTILRKRSRYVIKDGDLAEIMHNSPCIDAGAAVADVEYDILGRTRSQMPDIGPLEFSRALEVTSINDLELIAADADWQTPTDSLKLVFDVQVPPGFILNPWATYSVALDNHVVTSDQFSRSSRTRQSLLFTSDSGDSYLGMELLPRQKLLKVTLNVAGVQLQQDLAQHFLASDNPTNDPSVVYAPLRFGINAGRLGSFQTGDCWLGFLFEGALAVGKGSAPVLRPELP